MTRKLRRFYRSVKAISPIISVLLMIAIAVSAALVAFAWVSGYIDFTTTKVGKAIQIQSVSTNAAYVQNVGESPVTISDVYVDGVLVPETDYSIDVLDLEPSQTASIIFSQSFTTKQTTIKIVTKGGVSTEKTETFAISSRLASVDYVDLISDVDGSGDVGTSSNFDALQTGPDAVFCVLSEEDTNLGTNTVTLINHESFENSWPPSSPSSWSENGNWNKESNREYHGSYSADFDGYDSGRSGNLDTCNLDCSDAVSISVQFRFYDERLESNELRLYYYNGNSWQIIADLASVGDFNWNLYEETITDPNFFKSNFRIRWNANDIEGGSGGNNEHAYIDSVVVTKQVEAVNYELDKEVQFTGIDTSKSYDEICIYAGSSTGEALSVEVWNGGSWESLVSSLLPNQWNNVTYAVSDDTLTLRFVDTVKTNDDTQSSWEIDCVLLYAEP